MPQLVVLGHICFLDLLEKSQKQVTNVSLKDFVVLDGEFVSLFYGVDTVL